MQFGKRFAAFSSQEVCFFQSVERGGWGAGYGGGDLMFFLGVLHSKPLFSTDDQVSCRLHSTHCDVLRKFIIIMFWDHLFFLAEMCFAMTYKHCTFFYSTVQYSTIP